MMLKRMCFINKPEQGDTKHLRDSTVCFEKWKIPCQPVKETWCINMISLEWCLLTKGKC